MPYSKDQEERALNRLYQDIEQWQQRSKPKSKPQGTISVGFLMAGAMLLLAVLLLCSVGCGTVRGIGQDLQDASDIAREYMAEPERGYTGR